MAAQRVAGQPRRGGERGAPGTCGADDRLLHLLEATNVIPWEADLPDRTFTYVGSHAVRLLGYPQDEWYAPGFWRAHIYPEDRERAERGVPGEGGAPPDLDLEYRMITAGGEIVWIRDLVSAEKSEGQPSRLCGVMIDITIRKRAALLQAGLTRVLDLLARGMPLGRVLTELAMTIDAQQTGMRSSILRLDESGRRLLHVAGPHLPAAYNEAIHGAEIGPAVGSCGTAAYRGERVVVTDIATDPLWKDYRDLAAAAGLGACWSQPVKAADGRVLGTFAIYYDQPRRPSQDEISLIEQAAYLAGVAMEHDAAGEALRRNESALRVSHERIQYLAGRLLTAQEDERRRLARELHDDLAQRMALVGLETGRLERTAGGLPVEVRERLSAIQRLVGELAEDLHDLSRRLHPTILRDLGLVDAIRSECESFTDREGIPVWLDVGHVRRELPEDASICLYRVLQEALRNIAKHSRASDASVRLTELEGGLVLQIEDSGVGIGSGETGRQTGVGLASMRERVRIAGGRLEVGPIPGSGGTRVSATLPLPEQG